MPINKSELFDVDTMEGLLRHEGVCEHVKADLRRYKKRRINGNTVQITYDYSEGVRDFKKGRVYPVPFVGLATFPRDIRAALAAKYYDEIDCENSQPVLLVQIAKREGLSATALEEYVAKRGEVFESLQKVHKLSRDEAKQVCIAVLFGGYRDEHPLLPLIKAELDTLAVVICNRYPEYLEIARKSKETKKNKSNLNAAVLAQYVQDQETKILFAIDHFLAEKGYQMDVLQHDGGDVLKKNGESIPTSVLEEAQGAVLISTGFSIRITTKPLTCPFDFTAKDNQCIVPQNVLIDDSFAAKKFIALAGDRLRKVGNELYVLEADGVWETGEDSVRGLIASFEDKLIWKQYNASGGLSTFNYGGNTNNITKLLIQTKTWANPGPLPLQWAYTLSESSGTPEQVAIFLELVDLVSGKNTILKEYVIKWIAHILQKPYDLPGVMLILSGGKGVGKDTLFDFLIEFVFGKYSAINYTSNKQFFEKHDTGRKCKFFAKLEEADRRYCIENSSDLKAMVTGKSITFNPKNQKPIEVPNYTRYVFTTNKGNPMDFKEGERRFEILPCSSEKKGDLDYWRRVREVLFTEGGGRAVAEFLLAVDLSTFDVRKLPENKYQEAVVEAEESPEQRFINDWDGLKISATDFYMKYREFCTDNNYPFADTQKDFGSKMLPFIRDKIIDKARGCDGYSYRKNP
jgi:hypothetical protein